MNELRRAILALGRYSRWPREELRGMTPREFADYLATASELAEEAQNGS